MNHKLIAIPLLLVGMSLSAQIRVTSHQVGWESIPPQAQKAGYSLQKSVTAQIDNDAQLEEILLFGHDNGHWPEFDLFKFYVAVVGSYDKQVKYISDELVCDNYNLLIQDRNLDGKSEIYINYIQMDTFKVDSRGYNMSAVRCTDRIEFAKEEEE